MSNSTKTVKRHLEKTKAALLQDRDILEKSIRDIDSMMSQYIEVSETARNAHIGANRNIDVTSRSDLATSGAN